MMDKNMGLCEFHLWILIFVSSCLTMSSGQEAVGNSECKDSDICYTLYRASPGFTRAQTDMYCRGIGRSLTVIPDEDTQNAISRLAGRGTETDQFAWVGGLRGRGTRWKDPDGGFAQNPGRIGESNDSGSWCSGVKLTTFTPDHRVFPLTCSSRAGYRAVCERSTPCSTDTSVGRFNIYSVCHVVSDVMFTSWVEAQDHCERTDTGGNLAFSVIDRGSHFSGTYNNNEGYLWTGIQRRSWVWKSLTEALVTYTNWLPSKPRASDTGECLVVDLTKNGSWSVSDCNVTRNYFICEGPPITTSTTTVKTTMAATTLRITRPTPSPSTLTTTPRPNSATPPIITELNEASEDGRSTVPTELATTESETVRNPNACETRSTGSSELTIYKSLFGIFFVISVGAVSVAIVQSCRLARRNKKPKQINDEEKSHDYYNMDSVAHAMPTSDVTPGAVHHGNVSDGEYAGLDGATRDTPEVASPVYAQMS